MCRYRNRRIQEKPQGKDKLTPQLHILKILSRHGIRIDRRSTSFPDAQYTWRSSRRQLVFHAVAKIGASIGANSSSTRLRAGASPQFSFRQPDPMFSLITARILIADRISRAASDLSFEVMVQNSITSTPIFGRPRAPGIQLSSLTRNERAWAERRLSGRITELNQRMWRVRQRLDFETSRNAARSGRPNSAGRMSEARNLRHSQT